MLLESWNRGHAISAREHNTHRARAVDRHAGEAVRHAGAFASERCPRGRRVRHKTAWLLSGLALVASVLAAPQPCSAEDEEADTPSIVGYAFEGFGTGIATGLAVGYLATGPKFEGREWRTLLWGGGIGALTGLGLGLVLGVVDAGSVPHGRGVGFYIMRDSNYGYGLGALTGGIVGALIWASGGVAKDVLQGMAWGTVIGAGAGVILGVIEGSLRNSGSSGESTARRRRGLQLGLGFVPTREGAPLPYPSLSGRF
jgi:hypothetical protein